MTNRDEIAALLASQAEKATNLWPCHYASCEDTGYENGAGIQAEELYREVEKTLTDSDEAKEYIEEIFTALDKALYIDFLQYIDYENDDESDADYYCEICDWVKNNLLTNPRTVEEIAEIFFSENPCETLQEGFQKLS